MKASSKRIQAYFTSLQVKSDSKANRLIGALAKDIKQDSVESEDFIPFIKERDSIGRLISGTIPSKMSKLSLPSSSLSSRKFLKHPLTNPKLKHISPAVGAYYTPVSWIKPSFSVKKNLPPRVIKSEFDSPMESPRKASIELATFRRRRPRINMHSKRKAKKINEYDKILPENQAKLRMSSSISGLKIVGSPEEIAEALKFAQIRENQKLLTENIKSTFRELKKYYHY